MGAPAICGGISIPFADALSFFSRARAEITSLKVLGSSRRKFRDRRSSSTSVRFALSPSPPPPLSIASGIQLPRLRLSIKKLVDQLFNELHRRDIQGRAAIVVPIVTPKGPKLGWPRKLGFQVAQDAVGLLRVLLASRPFVVPLQPGRPLGRRISSKLQADRLM